LSLSAFQTESPTFDGDLEGEDVVIVQTIGPPQNEKLIQLFLMADNAKDLGERTVTAVIPYFGYARQDKRFRLVSVVSLAPLIAGALARGF